MSITQRIISELNETQNIMIRSIRRMLERGEDLKYTEKKSIEILETSELFMFKTIPWYERAYIKLKKTICICPSWWFRCSC